MQRLICLAALAVGLLVVVSAAAGAPGADRRLTNDVAGGYLSAYTIATGTPYTDDTLAECSVARARQNEPSVEIDPRNPQVIIGSSNDYCGVYAGSGSTASPVASGPIWLGYYRSENGGTSFQSSLVPGYPGDTSPYAALSKIRTASSGDPVIAWDSHGRVFMGSESSDDPAGSAKTFGDVWVGTFDNPAGEAGNTLNDGKRFVGSTVVAKGSSAPNLLGKFNDKTSIEADRTGGRCDGNAYFAWSRFTGNAGSVGIYFSRSTDHGATFSSPAKLTPSIHDVQFPDIAVTGSGNIYVTYRIFEDTRGHEADGIGYVKSTDCGKTFSAPKVITSFLPYDAQDQVAPEAITTPVTTDPGDSRADPGSPEDEGSAAAGTARDCGDFDSHCASGYTFFRRDTQVRSTADQANGTNEWVFLVYDPSKPGTQVQTGTTYGSIGAGTGSQSGIYYIRLNGANGTHTDPVLVDSEAVGHQLFPDIAVSGGVLHALWWDSRNDPAYSPARPIGNNATGTTFPSLDVYASTAPAATGAWAAATRMSDVSTNPNYEQFANRTVPFAGDYLWISAVGSSTFGVWTDWRDTAAGGDPREAGDSDSDSADVVQCRTFSGGAWGGDTCVHAGGLDQNIYGDSAP
jgi:hypothetical protein